MREAIGPLFAEQPPLARLVAWPAYRWLVVGTVCVGAFLWLLDASIAGLVLPTHEEVFNALRDPDFRYRGSEKLREIDYRRCAYCLTDCCNDRIYWRATPNGSV